MNYTFTPIERRNLYYKQFPDNTIRITKKSVRISGDVGISLGLTQDHRRLSWEYDQYNQVIRVQQDDFGFNMYKVKDSQDWSWNQSTGFRESDILMGDYQPVKGEPGIFKLAK